MALKSQVLGLVKAGPLQAHCTRCTAWMHSENNRSWILIHSLTSPLGQDALYSTTMGALAIAIATVYYTIYPIIYFLSLVLTLVLILVSPIIHLSHYVMTACAYPYHFLGKFEVSFMLSSSVRKS